uniref:Uncharacterized protein n=1 Tax=Arundo donax TaxID=35708 RepID=A0A0A9HJR0_ARUDO
MISKNLIEAQPSISSLIYWSNAIIILAQYRISSAIIHLQCDISKQLLQYLGTLRVGAQSLQQFALDLERERLEAVGGAPAPHTRRLRCLPPRARTPELIAGAAGGRAVAVSVNLRWNFVLKS